MCVCVCVYTQRVGEREEESHCRGGYAVPFHTRRGRGREPKRGGEERRGIQGDTMKEEGCRKVYLERETDKAP